MIKVTFIGAGSTVFMKNILTDILLEKNFSNCEIVLQDIDDRRLKTSNLVAEKVSKSIGANPKIIIEKNQKKALSGCLLYTSPSPRDRQKSRMPSSA